MPYSALYLLVALAGSLQPAPPPLLIGDVTMNSHDIVFAHAGDLWRVGRSGGTARRIFSDGASRTACVFSPNGRRLAFSRISSNDVDIFVAPAEGGESERVTWHPKSDILRGWSADGEKLIFSSDREQDGSSELYATGIGDPLPQRLPMSCGAHGAFSPDGKKIAYTPRTIFYSNVARRFYRGGSMAPLWVVDLASGLTEKITDGKSSVITPIWIGSEIYFATDRIGSFNLAVYDFGSKTIREITHYPTKGITSLGSGAGDIVFARDGRIYLYNLASKQITLVPITIERGDLRERDERATRSVPASRYLNGLALSPDGKRAFLEARGEILDYDLSAKSCSNLTRTGGVAERDPAVSPDGKSLAYFSDESGEYRLHVRSIDGGAVKKISIEPNPTYYRELQWSPDGKRLSFSDQRLNLLSVEIASERVDRVATSEHLAQGPYHARWSPDGRWLAYAKALPTRIRAIFLWDSATGRTTQISDGLSQDESPVFDKSGRYLYFTTSSNARNAAASDIGWALMSSMLADPYTTRSLTIVVLGSTDGSPSGAAGLAANQGRVDLDGISRRIVPLSLGGRDMISLEAGKPGSVIVQVQEWPSNAFAGPTKVSLHRFDAVVGGPLSKLADNADDFAVSDDGSTVLYLSSGQVRTVPTEGSPSDSPPLDLTGAKLDVDPVTEWKQMFHEAWRMMRDYFYDPNYHGQDVRELESHYAAYLPSITRRSDLNNLLGRAFGEISVSHLRVGGGDSLPISQPPSLRVGLLGASYLVDNGRFRFKEILLNGRYGAGPRAPLDQPGVDVRVGDILLEVNGKPVTADRNLYSYFEGTIGRPTKIKVAANAGGVAREYTVTPLPGENGLRTSNWVRKNAEKVNRLSGGRLAYVYIAGHDEDGYNEFFRVLNASGDKQGLIIDQRFNGGGITPDVQIEALLRSPKLAYSYRYGREIMVPPHWINGPKVLMINEANGSAAETFSLMFKANKVGTVVGKTTYGGGIGTALFQQPLIDNGLVAIPNRASYNPHSGTWDVENEGIHPDVDVEIMPADYMAGRDPQLEAAVQTALKALQTYKKPLLRKPVPPVHAGGRKSGG